MALNDVERELFESLYFEESVPIREKYQAELRRIDFEDDINKHASYFKVITEYARSDIDARVSACVEAYNRLGKYPDDLDFGAIADELMKRADRFKELFARHYRRPFSGIPQEFVDRLLEELSGHLSQIAGFAVAPLRRLVSEGKVAASLMKVPLNVFISYKWEDAAHNQWVEMFATDLRTAGLDAKLDQWEVRLGDSFTDYMTSKIAEADVVLFIMTTRSVEAVEAPTAGGAVKFEMQMATSRRIAGEKMRLIGVYREGTQTAAHLRDHKYADFRDNSRYRESLQELVDDLLGHDKRPPLGSRVDPNVKQGNQHVSQAVQESTNQLSLKDQILMKFYDSWLQNPEDIVGSQRCRGLGDEDDIHEAILDLGSDGLLSHGEPIRTGVAQTIRRIPLIKLSAKGKAAAKAIKQSLS